MDSSNPTVVQPADIVVPVPNAFVEALRAGSGTGVARALAAAGVPVFPLVGKVPVKNTRGFKDASCDGEFLDTWWPVGGDDRFGVGVSPAAVGLCVLDADTVDHVDGGSLDLAMVGIRQLGLDPSKLVHRATTASGGLHFWLRVADPCRPPAAAAAIKPCVDVRCAGSYVCVWRSDIDGGAYDVSGWLGDVPWRDAPKLPVYSQSSRSAEPLSTAESEEWLSSLWQSTSDAESVPSRVSNVLAPLSGASVGGRHDACLKALGRLGKAARRGEVRSSDVLPELRSLFLSGDDTEMRRTEFDRMLGWVAASEKQNHARSDTSPSGVAARAPVAAALRVATVDGELVDDGADPVDGDSGHGVDDSVDDSEVANPYAAAVKELSRHVVPVSKRNSELVGSMFLMVDDDSGESSFVKRVAPGRVQVWSWDHDKLEGRWSKWLTEVSDTAWGVPEALERLGFEFRWNARSQRLEVKAPGVGPVDGEAWHPELCWDPAGLSDRLPSSIAAMVADRCVQPVYVPGKPTQGGGVSMPRIRVNKLSVTTSRVAEAWMGWMSARCVEVDPFKGWLLSLPPWDQVSRLRSWLGELFTRHEDTDPMLLEHVSALIVRGMAERAFQPGCKIDEVPVLIGAQGGGKSTALEFLLPGPDRLRDRWFNDSLSLADTETVEFVHSTEGKVLVEFAEMIGVTRADLAKLKQRITARTDTVRKKYGRGAGDYPRHWFGVGTTNQPIALPFDETGNRRYLPVRFTDEERDTSTIKRWLDEHRVQLFAEAVACMGRPLHITDPVLREAAREAQGAATERFAYEGAVLDVVVNSAAGAKVLIEEVAHDAGLWDEPEVGDKTMPYAMRKRVEAVLREIGGGPSKNPSSRTYAGKTQRRRFWVITREMIDAALQGQQRPARDPFEEAVSNAAPGERARAIKESWGSSSQHDADKAMLDEGLVDGPPPQLAGFTDPDPAVRAEWQADATDEQLLQAWQAEEDAQSNNGTDEPF